MEDFKVRPAVLLLFLEWFIACCALFPLDMKNAVAVPPCIGEIACPAISTSPIDAVKALWGGQFPEFDSLDAVNELLRARRRGPGR